MRRVTALIGGLFVVGSLPACGSDSDEAVETEAPAPDASDVSDQPANTVEDGLDLTVDVVFPDPYPESLPPGPFSASGAAVDAGWFCADGTFTQLSYELGEEYGVELWTMLLDCADLDGSITLSVKGQGEGTPTDWHSDITWTVVDPTGSMAGASGSGGGVSECVDMECREQYVGSLLIESA